MIILKSKRKQFHCTTRQSPSRNIEKGKKKKNEKKPGFFRKEKKMPTQIKNLKDYKCSQRRASNRFQLLIRTDLSTPMTWTNMSSSTIDTRFLMENL